MLRRLGLGILPACVLCLGLSASANAFPTAIPGNPDRETLVGYDGGTAFGVEMSHDGRFVLWTKSFGGTPRGMWTDTATGETIELTVAFRLEDLSSGGSVAMVRNTYLPNGLPWLYALDVHTGARAPIPGPEGVDGNITTRRFINDGTEVIYGFHAVHGYEVYRVNLATQRVIKVTELESLHHLEFSGDGRYLVAWKSEGGIFRRDLVTGHDIDLGAVAHPEHVVLSENGRFVLIDGVLHDADTGSAVAITGAVDKPTSSGEGHLQVADVSDDGTKVVYATDVAIDPTDTNGRTDIYMWSTTNSRHRRISTTDLGTPIDGPALVVKITPDGSRAMVDTHSYDAAMPDVAETDGYTGSLLIVDLTEPLPSLGVVDSALVPGGGYLQLDRAGRVSAFGGATEFDDCMAHADGRSLRRLVLDPGEQASSLSPTHTGHGYWIFTTRGRAVTCGDAEFLGDLSDIELDGPVIDSVATASGKGYYMVAEDGGVFAFGDAVYRGSVPEVLPGTQLAGPIVAITVTETNRGYRMLAADGGMFNFGDAAYYGSIPQVLPGVPLAGPAVEMVASTRGYLIVGNDGGIFNFGESVFHGSLGGAPPHTPIGSVVVLPDLDGYVMFDEDGNAYPFGTGDSILDQPKP